MTDKPPKPTRHNLNKALAEVVTEFENGEHIPKRKKIGRDTWGGAGVIVTADKNRKGYKSDFVLVTQHADVVGWYFNRIKPVAYSLGNIDYFTKLRFFMTLPRLYQTCLMGLTKNRFLMLWSKKRETFSCLRWSWLEKNCNYLTKQNKVVRQKYD